MREPPLHRQLRVPVLAGLIVLLVPFLVSKLSKLA
jgi:hypothetical protein